MTEKPSKRQRREPPSLSKIVQDLSSPCNTTVYNALVFLRTTFIKEKDGVARLRQHGGLDYLLSIIQRPNQKLVDISLSILGNCCMEEKTRLKVQKLQGIPKLINILKNVDSDSILNRAGRTLANLAQNEACREEIHEEEEHIELIVKTLNNTEDKECQQTYIRLLRILAGNTGERNSVIQSGGIRAVGKLLGSEHEEVINGALKTIKELLKGGLVGDSAAQLAAGGAFESLIKLSGGNSTNQEVAWTLLLYLLKHEVCRPAFGNAGGIDFLIKLVQDRSEDKDALPVVNAICLCCQEVINRVRIRDSEGLQLLLNLLGDENFRMIHDRIISALVCFLYDEMSFKILLQNDLVPLLLKHLQRISELEKYLNKYQKLKDISTDPDEKTKDFHGRETKDVSYGTSVADQLSDSKVKNEGREDLKTCENQSDKSNSKTNQETPREEIKMPKIDVLEKQTEEFSVSEINAQSVDQVGELELKNAQTGSEKNFFAVDVADGKQEGSDATTEDNSKVPSRAAIRYSINSPTYREIAEGKVEMSEPPVLFENGNFDFTRSDSPPLSPYSLSLGSPFSPLSIASSYVSPRLSPEFSPVHNQSPRFSPLAVSSALHTSAMSFGERSPDGTTVYTLASFSPLMAGTAPMLSTGGDDSTFMLHYSSEEDEDGDRCKTDTPLKPSDNDKGTSQQSTIDLPSSSDNVGSTFASALSSDPVYSDAVQNSDFSTILTGADLNAVDDSAETPKPKVHRISHNQRRRSSKLTPEGKLKVQKALARSSSQSSVNFNDLIPPIPGEDRAKSKDRKKVNKNTTEQNIFILLSRISHMEDVSEFIMRENLFTILCEYLVFSRNPLRRCTRILHRLCENPLHFNALISTMVPSILHEKLILESAQLQKMLTNMTASKGKNMSEEEKDQLRVPANDTEDSCLSLLSVINMSAESNYGVGDATHILMRGSHKEKQKCAVAIPYIYRNFDVLRKMLFSVSGWEYLIQACQQQEDDTVQRRSVGAMAFLAQKTAVDTSSYIPSDLSLQQNIEHAGARHENVNTSKSDTSLEGSGDNLYNDRKISQADSGSTVMISVKDGVHVKYAPADSENIEVISMDEGKCEAKLLSGPRKTVEFALDDGNVITTDRSLLCQSSTVFQAMLEGHYMEANKLRIRLSGVGYQAFQYVLDILQGKPTMPDLSVLLDSLAVADQYLITSVTQTISRVVSSHHLSVTNVPHLFEGAVKHNASMLSNCCLAYMLTTDVTLQSRHRCCTSILCGPARDTAVELLKNIFLKKLGKS